MESRRVRRENEGCCPRCGASPSNQRWKPKSNLVDMSKLEHIETFNPTDAIMCHNCGMAFQVNRLEVDDCYIVDWSVMYDYVPNFCPQCGKRFPEED